MIKNTEVGYIIYENSSDYILVKYHLNIKLFKVVTLVSNGNISKATSIIFP